MSQPWNHNIQYHRVVLAALPYPCGRALDVGCGQGLLTHRLATRCGHVTGIDKDATVLASARSNAPENVTYVQGDVMSFAFEPASFDLITAVATLHHLPLDPALRRFSSLLAPGGVLAVIGLYRHAGVKDHLFAIAAMGASRMLRLGRVAAGHDGPMTEQHAPMTEPRQTLAEIRSTAATCLPGARLERRLLFRYRLLWRKPGAITHHLSS